MSLVPYRSRGSVLPYRSRGANPFAIARQAWGVRQGINRALTPYLGNWAYNPYTAIANLVKKKGKKKSSSKSKQRSKVNDSEPVIGGIGATYYFNKSYKVNQKQRKAYLKKNGVSNFNPIYQFNSGTHQCVTVANKVHFGFVGSPLIGLNSKTMFDSIYTNQSFTDNDQRIVLTSQSTEYILKNQSDHPVYMKLHYVKFKKLWTSTFGGTSTIISDGFNDIGMANDVDQEIGASLFQNPKFMEWIKIIKSHSFLLQPAETRKVIIKSTKLQNRSFNYKKESDISVLQGSKCLMYETHGVPVHDQTTSGNIGLSNGIIDVFYNMKYTYRVVDASQHSKTYITTGYTAPATPFGFRIADIAEGAVET